MFVQHDALIDGRCKVQKLTARVTALLALVALTLALAAPQAYANPLQDFGNAFLQIFDLEAQADSAEDAISGKVADELTLDSYEDNLLQTIGGKQYVSTAAVGRIWTDKSVSAGSMPIPEGGEVPLDGSDFMVALSALSSTSNTVKQISKPLDIVMVLETGGTLETAERDANMKAAASSFVQAIADMGGSNRMALIAAKASSDEVIPGTWVDLTSESEVDAAKAAINELGSSNAIHIDNAYGAVSELESRPTAQKIVITLASGGHNKNDSFNDSNAGKDVMAAFILKKSGSLMYTIGVFEGANSDTPQGSAPEDEAGQRNRYFQGLSSNYPNATDWDSLGDRAESGRYYWPVDSSGQIDFGEVFGNIMHDIEKNFGDAPTHVQEGDSPASGGYVTFTDKLGDFMQVDAFSSIIYEGKQYTEVDSSFDEATNTYTYSFEGTVTGASPDEEEIPLSNILITVKKGQPSSAGGVAIEGDEVAVKIPASLIPLREYNVEMKGGNTTIAVVNTTPIRVVYGVSLRDGVAGMFSAPDSDTPEEVLDYIKGHMKDGKVSFYSNYYSPDTNADLGNVGDTVADYEPANSNWYYRFLEDTPLYDAGTGEQISSIKEIVKDGTYYYELPYYRAETAGMGGSGEVVPATAEYLRIETSGANVLKALGEDFLLEQGDAVFIKEGSPRFVRVNDFTRFDKAGDPGNPTGTAELATNLHWYEGASEDRFRYIDAYLGNNGAMSIEVPGALAITKHAEISDSALNAADVEQAAWLSDQEFAFDIKVTGAKDGVYAAEVVDASGHAVEDGIESVKIVGGECNDAEGNGIRLSDDQTLRIYGLKSGLLYTVAEAEMPPGFKQTSAKLNGSEVEGEAESKSIEGTVVAGRMAQLEFENTYSVTPTTPPTEIANAQKAFGDWNDWNNIPQGSSFTIRMTATNYPQGATDLFPDQSDVRTDEYGNPYIVKTVTNSDPFSFGEFAFGCAGEYRYTIREETPGKKIPGVRYSSELYGVHVTVKDDREGKLTVSNISMMLNGKEVGPDPQTGLKTAVIHNSYSMEPAEVELSAYKEYIDHSGGKPLTGGMFTFAIQPLTDGAPVPMYVNVEGNYESFAQLGSDDVGPYYKTSNYPNGDISLGTMAFDDNSLGGKTSQTFVYKVWEAKPVDAEGEVFSDDDPDKLGYQHAGMTYDESIYYAHVTVEKIDTGESGGAYLEVTNVEWKLGEDLKSENADFAEGQTVPRFKNGYTAQPTDLVFIQGRKTLNGRDMLKDESFGFVLEPGNEVTRQAVEADEIIFDEDATKDVDEVTVEGDQNGKPQPFAFGGITFNKVGEYAFDARETKWNGESLPASEPKGMQFSSHVCKVIVSVNLVGPDNKLEAAVNYVHGADHLQFTNTYTAAPVVYGGVDVSKTLVGRSMAAGEFGFTIEPVSEDATAKGLAQADKSFVNPNVKPSGSTDYMGGKLKLRFSQADVGKTFVYEVKEAKPVDAEGEVFPDDDSVRSGYQHAGVTYDETVYQVAITVYDNGDGTLRTETTIITPRATDDAEGYGSAVVRPVLSFRNAYAAQPADFDTASVNLSKTIDGRDWQDGDVFSFTLRAHTVGAPMPSGANEDGTCTIEVKKGDITGGDANAAVSFDFGAITFTFTEPRTYVYTVAEKHAGEFVDGLLYDPYAAAFVVTVADDGAGKLTAELSWSFDTEFVNSYVEPENSDVSVQLCASKALAGRDLREGEFSFELRDTEGKVLQTKTNGTDGNVIFDAIEYTQPGEHAYTVREVLPSDDDATTDGIQKDGVTYDEASRDVKVVVTDNGEGSLSARVNGEQADGATAAKFEIGAFENAYFASTTDETEAGIAAYKSMDGRELVEGEFLFQLKTRPADGEGVLVGEACNAADGAVVFDKLAYTTEGLIAAVDAGYATKAVDSDGKSVYTLNYQVNEASSQLPGGVTATSRSFNVSVKVADSGSGTLSTQVVYPDGAESLEFENAYSTGGPISVAFKGSKNLYVPAGLTAPDIAGKYSFSLSGVDEAGNLAPLPEDVTATNDAEGNVSFAPVKFTLDMLKDVKPDESNHRAKTFTYKVTETGNVAGVTNDSQETKAFSVTLHDDGDGNLHLMYVNSEDRPEGDYFAFTNSYGVQPESSSVTDQIPVTKELTGRALKAGEFAFELLEGGEVVATGVNDANGKVTFAPIEYTRPGEHSYTVREALPAADDDAATEGVQKDGVTYDQATYVVRTVVTDSGAGTLQAEIEYVGGPPSFVNIYAEPSAPAVPDEPDDESADEPAEIIAKTGDSTIIAVTAWAIAAIGSASVALTARFRKQASQAHRSRKF